MSSPLIVAVVLPAHNEADHIGAVVHAIPEWIDHVIVVDDSSSDETSAVVTAIDDRRLQLIRHAEQQGVGAAMKTGYRAAIAAGADVIVKMDSDGQMLPAELARLIRPFQLELADYAKGNRFYFRDSTLGMPAERSFGNSLLSFMTKVASGYWHVYDSQCGYTAVATPFLRLLDLDQVADDYFFENDMLIRLNALSARVVDVPVSTVYGSETSDVNVLKVALTFPPRLVGAGARRFWRKHLVTDFGAIAALSGTGLLLVAFGMLFGAYHWALSLLTHVAATTGTVMVAVLPLIVGIQLVLQALALSVAGSSGARETTEYVRQLIRSGEFD